MKFLSTLRTTLLLALTFVVFSVSTPTHAQSDALKISMMPAVPGPSETVTITVEDFSRDLNKIKISWSVDGKVISSGIGVKQFKVNTGAIGTATKVDINMDGVVESLTLRPTVTDLIWQADSYTPPFYEGKALHTAQDPITVYAEPFVVSSNGNRIDPNTLVYRWKIDGKVNANASGYGKRTLRITPSILVKPVNVSVEVSSTEGTYNSKASITIPNSNPEVLLYENHPLYGIRSNNSLNDKTFKIEGSEANIVARPFFFSRAQEELNLVTYAWKLNGAQTDQTGEKIIVRTPPGEGSGRSFISLNVKNLERYLQFADASFYTEYDKRPATGQTQNVF